MSNRFETTLPLAAGALLGAAFLGWAAARASRGRSGEASVSAGAPASSATPRKLPGDPLKASPSTETPANTPANLAKGAAIRQALLAGSGASSGQLLAGKIAVVTGASSGIGRAVAEALHAAGAKVALGARRLDRLRATCARLNETEAESPASRAHAPPKQAIAVKTDVTDAHP